MDQAPTENSLAARLKLAKEHAERGRVQDAEAIFIDIVADDPACVGARVQLAHLKRHGGDRSASLAVLEAAAAIAPQQIGLQLEIADDLRELRRFDEANAVLGRMTVQYPNNIAVRISISRLKRREGNRDASLAALQAAAVIDPNDVGVQLELANDLRELGRTDEVETLLERLKGSNPCDVRILAGLAHLRRRRGDRGGALALAQAAIEVDPQLVAVQFDMADDLYELGRFDQAEAVLDRLKAKDPRNIGLRVRLAHLKRRRGDRTGSLAVLDEAAAIDSEHAGVQLERADDLRELGRFADAEDVLYRVLDRDRRNVEGLISLSRLRRRQDDRAGSLTALDAAAAIDARHGRVQLERADDLRELGRDHEAEKVLRILLDRDPRDAAALVCLSRVKRSQGERTDSLAALEAAAAIVPRDLGIQLELIRELEHQGRSGDVESRLKALLSDTASPAVLSALIRHLIAADRLDEADELCRSAVLSNPTHAHNFVLLGIIARQRGDRWQALARFEAACRLDPSSHEALQELVAEHRELGHLAECQELLDRVLRDTPNLLIALLQKGQLDRKRGRHQDALQAFQSAVELHPHSNAAKIELARELRFHGKPAASLELLLSVLRSDPANFAAFEQINEYLWSAENFEASLAVCEQWMRAFPNHGVPIARAGRALFELGENDRAFTLLDADIQASHRNEIEAVRIDGLRRRQDFDAAAASLAAWELRAGPVSAVWTRRVQLAMDRGDYALAEQQLGRVAPVTVADRSRISITKGQIAEARWQTEAAAGHFEQALLLHPDDAGAHSELARIYLKMLDLDKSRFHLKRHVGLGASDSISRGQVSRTSQTHVGQLLDEFALDQDLLRQLKAAVQGSERIVSLKQLVRAHPDHTPTAIALLMALRRDGLLDLPAARGAGLVIPRRIVQFWDSDETPHEIRSLMETWQAHHGGFDYQLFNDETAAHFLEQHHAEHVRAAFARCREPAQRSDIFRLAYLATRGGIYADADDRCFKPVNEFLPEGTTFVAHQEDCGAIGNNFLATVPDHPVITAALELAVAAVNRGDSDFPWLSTGPGLLTRAFASYVADAAAPSWCQTTSIFGLGEMKREVGIHCQVRYKKTSKHWSRHMLQREHRRSWLAELESEVMTAIMPPARIAGSPTTADERGREGATS